ncbi:IclR family transcriptional regulator [Grimontia kaedaensis]|uniref:IclR family transcriptional regulator n=1 Tax=Grimontia kaedaensis TaxID=2872157 RepID=A0ABY4WV94_9GAMM|nr:IclR family transcriptional regulator [Grimontia kaedaensis]USH03498.1 IclR family transcriptional regulator [Grimontia kaedaensis]
MAKDRVEAVERALAVLNAFSDKQSVLTLKEISDKTGLYKSTILRLIGSLEHFGFISKQLDGRYRLGPSLWRLGSIYQKSFDSETVIRPMLEKLRDAVNETAAFYIKSGDSRICLYRENAKREVCHNINEGSEIPIKRGAAGRVLLAYTGAEGQPFEAIREQGWYLSKGERNPDLAAIAVPVLTPDGVLKGALSISGLIFRFDGPLVDQCVELLNQAADVMGKELIDSPLM